MRDFEKSSQSVFAAALRDRTLVETTFRQSGMSQKKVLGLSEAKISIIQKEFMTGDQYEGNLDDLVVLGSNKLKNEIKHARSIPEQDRILVRKESALVGLIDNSEARNNQRGSAKGS